MSRHGVTWSFRSIILTYTQWSRPVPISLQGRWTCSSHNLCVAFTVSVPMASQPRGSFLGVSPPQLTRHLGLGSGQLETCPSFLKQQPSSTAPSTEVGRLDICFCLQPASPMAFHCMFSNTEQSITVLSSSCLCTIYTSTAHGCNWKCLCHIAYY